MDWNTIVLLSFIGGAVGVQPVLRPGQTAVERSQNESYVVTCSAKENTTLTWTGPKGKAIPLSTGRVHVENKGQYGFSLLFDRIESQDRGRYTCTSHTGQSASLELSVVTTSKFVNTPKEHGVIEFQNTLIRCEVVGDPKPLVTWHRHGKAIDSLQQPKYKVEPQGLRIVNASKSDGGKYACRAVQVGKEDTFIKTIDIVLKVQHKPEWREPVNGSVVVLGYVGGESNLTCEALAQPEANYSWSRNGKDLRTLRLNLTEIHEPDRSVLQIRIPDDSMYGPYDCQARNKLGTISKSYELRKGEKPAPPTLVKPTDTTVHTATLKIASDEADLKGYRVQFVISPPGHEISWHQPEYQDLPKTEDDRYVLRDLLEDTPYTVRVSTRGLAGLSDYTSETKTLRTRKVGEVTSSARLLSLDLALLTVLASLAAVH